MAVFPAQRDVRVIEVPAPELRNEHEVMIRTERLVLGHEALGEVVAVGPAVRRVAHGDLVVITLRRPCGYPECIACRAGRQDFCMTGRFRERGISGADGFMTELVVEDERYLVRVPKALADVAVLVEPLTIAAKAAVDLAKLDDAPSLLRRSEGIKQVIQLAA